MRLLGCRARCHWLPTALVGWEIVGMGVRKREESLSCCGMIIGVCESWSMRMAA